MTYNQTKKREKVEEKTPFSHIYSIFLRKRDSRRSLFLFSSLKYGGYCLISQWFCQEWLLEGTKETEHGKILLFGFFFSFSFDEGCRISRSVSNPVVNEPAYIRTSVINGRVNSWEGRVSIHSRFFFSRDHFTRTGSRILQDTYECWRSFYLFNITFTGHHKAQWNGIRYITSRLKDFGRNKQYRSLNNITVTRYSFLGVLTSGKRRHIGM